MTGLGRLPVPRTICFVMTAITSEAAATAYDRHTGSGESIFQGARFLPGDLGKILDNGKLITEGRKRRFINVSLSLRSDSSWTLWNGRNTHRDAVYVRVHRVSVHGDLGNRGVAAGSELAFEI